jgi:DNA replication protein DnaC
MARPSVRKPKPNRRSRTLGGRLRPSNLPFDEWTGVFASERLTGALLDRLTHHVHILELNGDSFRLKHSKRHISDDQPPRDPG